MKTLLVLLVLMSAVCMASPVFAWWLTIRIEPTEAVYRGIRVEKLSTPLSRLSLLSCQSAPRQFTEEQCEEITINQARFHIIDDFNHDGKSEIAEVGVAVAKDGTRIRVLIISEEHNPKKNQIFSTPDNGFSLVYLDEGRLYWNTCMECGHAEELHWNRKLNRYELLAGEQYGLEPSNNSFKPKPLRGSA